MLTCATFGILTNKWRSSLKFRIQTVARQLIVTVSCHARSDRRCLVCRSDPGNRTDRGVQPHGSSRGGLMGLVFRLSNVLVLPFWAVMILLPRWRWTSRIARSAIGSVVPATLY